MHKTIKTLLNLITTKKDFDLKSLSIYSFL